MIIIIVVVVVVIIIIIIIIIVFQSRLLQNGYSYNVTDIVKLHY
jgi:hypothetical protein